MAERTPWSLSGALRGMFGRQKIDETTWDDLEEALITADFGPDITDEIVEQLREQVARFHTEDPKDLKRMLRELIEERLSKFDTTLNLRERPAADLDVDDTASPEIDLSGLPDLPDVSSLLARLVDERIPMALLIDLVNPAASVVDDEVDRAPSDVG